MTLVSTFEVFVQQVSAVMTQPPGSIRKPPELSRTCGAFVPAEGRPV